jgi:WD40 repeat protein
MKPFSKSPLRNWHFQCLRLALPFLGFAVIAPVRGEGEARAKNDGGSEARAVTEDDSGGLHGDYIAMRKPLRELALPGKGDIRGMSVTPDAKRLVFHELDRTAEGAGVSRVSVVDLASGKVTLLQQWAQAAGQRMLAIAPDGKSVVLEEVEDGLAGRYDLATGKKIRRYDSPGNKTVGSLQVSPDGKRMAGGSRDLGAVYWDLEKGDANHVALDFVSNEVGFFVYPLSGRKTLLVIALPEKKGDPTKLVLVEPEGGGKRPLTEIGENFDIRFDSSGKTLFVFRQRNPDKVAWTNIEVWDVDTAKITRTIDLKPPMSSMGLTLTHDGRHLFLHQYMMQQAVVWNLKQGQPTAVVAPENGGFSAMAITPDGNVLVGLSGQWKNGSLRPDKIALFDTSSLVR